MSPRGTLCLTFDNLNHPVAAEAVPALLEELGSRGLAATFFVEGVTAEVYPGLLAEVGGRGHEVAFHAWEHEQWAELTASEQAENLARGQAAFEAIGIELAGLRPPGGGLGPGGVGVLRDAGLRYCSPAGAGAGHEEGVALLPFRWRDVDASSFLPGLDSVREEIAGEPGPLEPGTFLGALEGELERLGREGGFRAVVLHLAMLGWLGVGLGALLDRIASASGSGDLRVAPCAAVADEVLADAGRFEGGTELDTRSWTG